VHDSSYENLEAVSRTLRVYGKVFKVGGAVVAVAGIITFGLGLADRGMDATMHEMMGVFGFLGGLGLHALGIIVAAGGEALLALRESVHAQKETVVNTAEAARLLKVATK
jgi:hypothetical protein